MIRMNTPYILNGNQVQFTVLRSTHATWCVMAVLMFGEMMPFQQEFDHEHATPSTTKLRENQKENKNSTF